MKTLEKTIELTAEQKLTYWLELAKIYFGNSECGLGKECLSEIRRVLEDKKDNE